MSRRRVWGVRRAFCRGSRPALAAALPLALAASAACIDDLPPAEPPPSTPLEVGQTRRVELRYLRLDVSNYEEVLTRADILELPEATRRKLWLFDLPLSGGPSAPRSIENAFTLIKGLDPATLSPPSRNLQRLLSMTPETADLEGTSLAELIDLAPLVGISPAQVLSDLMGVRSDEPILSTEVLAEATLRHVIGSHPNARLRPGPVTAERPDGLYPVTPGSLPITLADAAANFATLATTFGPYDQGGLYHPGFVTGEVSANVLSDDFKITIRINLNALPYKGVDLRLGAPASVNPVASQIARLFDFDDPGWLRVEGLGEEAPSFSLTFRVTEAAEFVPGGLSPAPAGVGSSPAARLPDWALERVMFESGRLAFAGQNATVSYGREGEPEPLFSATVVDGWQETRALGNLGSPPPPSYLWDVLLEVGQVRLHDGGVAEGEGAVEFTLEGVGVGLDARTIEASIRDNLRADPASLTDVAADVLDNGAGEADFYYVRPRPEGPPERQGDWLFFVTPGDLPAGEGGVKRPYDYERPGFYADEGLTQKISTQDEVDGDVEHEKVKLDGLSALYAPGKGGAVYRVEVGPKPSLARRIVDVTRVR
ncbi:MAG TPA: acetyltransferase [Polyangiaceae bacterium]|nr:acetyltransferase [Polyangiaceae bacterium]